MVGTYALSKGYYDVFFKKASQVRTLMINDFKEAFRKCHVEVSSLRSSRYGGRILEYWSDGIMGKELLEKVTD